MISVSTGKTPNKTINRYPYIGVYADSAEKSNFMVLFTSKNSGICIASGDSVNHPGTYSDCWTEYEYTPVPEVTIKSEV